MDLKLRQLSEEEAASTVESGNIVPPHRDSDSSYQSIEAEWQESSMTADKEVKPKLPPGPVKFVDRLAPDCSDYPWEHPRFRASAFQAPRQFCNEGPRIPIWFHGEEQLGDEVVQIPVSPKTPVDLVQTALLHQCDEASRAIWRKVQEIRDLERFAADAHAACFWDGAGDLQIGLLSAGMAPSDLRFPSVPKETQETGCQAEPSTQSTSTQHGPGICFIKRTLKDCDLQPSSTKIMDEYLQKHGYGPINKEDDSGHPFCLRACVIRAIGGHFRSVSPIQLRTTPDSEVQAFHDLDREMYPSRPFRVVHMLAYKDDMYPVILPTRSHRTIMQQLAHSLVELVKPLPLKDSLLTRGEYVRAAAADSVPNGFGQRTSE